MKVKYIDRSFGVDGTNGTRWRDVARRVWGYRLIA